MTKVERERIDRVVLDALKRAEVVSTGELAIWLTPQEIVALLHREHRRRMRLLRACERYVVGSSASDMLRMVREKLE
jgi:hypothetical protein